MGDYNKNLQTIRDIFSQFGSAEGFAIVESALLEWKDAIEGKVDSSSFTAREDVDEAAVLAAVNAVHGNAKRLILVSHGAVARMCAMEGATFESASLLFTGCIWGEGDKQGGHSKRCPRLAINAPGNRNEELQFRLDDILTDACEIEHSSKYFHDDLTKFDTGQFSYYTGDTQTALLAYALRGKLDMAMKLACLLRVQRKVFIFGKGEVKRNGVIYAFCK